MFHYFFVIVSSITVIKHKYIITLQIIQTPGLWETDHRGFSLAPREPANAGGGLCGGYCLI